MEKFIYQNPQLEIADHGNFIAGNSPGISEGDSDNSGTGGSFDTP